MASVTYWKIDSQNNRVQVTEEFTPNSVGVGTYVADRCDHPEGNKSTPSYPNINEQLDMLWHDIDDGKFGTDAKTSSFYTSIKNVKDSNPKP